MEALLDFLLECVGFPPSYDRDELVALVERSGEPTAWRGPQGVHKRLPLGDGLELRLDQDEQQEFANLWPHYEVPWRMRVAVERLTAIPDQPHDVLLHGTANPPLPGEGAWSPDSFRLASYLSDRRRLPRVLPRGHVLAVSVAGFALDVSSIRPPTETSEARFAPLGAADEPGGCMDVSARVRRVRHLRNPITGIAVRLVEVDAPGRALPLFVSAWQLEEDGLPLPRPGWQVDGCFVFTGRVAGGLPAPREQAFLG